MLLLTDKENESNDNQRLYHIYKKKFNEDDLESDGDDDDGSNCGNSDKKGNLMIWKLLMTKMMTRDLSMVMIFKLVWDLVMNLMIILVW